MSEQLRESLRNLAGKATQGQWWIDSHGHTMIATESLEVVFQTPFQKGAVRHPETGNLSNWRNDWDASYIATANPANVLAVLAEFDTLDQRLQEAERFLKELRLGIASAPTDDDGQMQDRLAGWEMEIDAFLAGKGDKP